MTDSDSPDDPELSASLRDASRIELEPSLDFTALYDDVQQSIANERGARAFARSLPSSLRIAVASGLAVGTAAVMWSMVPRSDMDTYPVARFAIFALSLAAMIVVTLYGSLRPLHRPAPPDWLTAMLPLTAVAIPCSLAFWPEAPGGELVLDPLLAGLHCFGVGAAFVLPMFVLWRALDRSSMGAPDRVMLAASAAGVSGNLILHATCGINSQAHILLAHGGLAVCLVLVGLLWNFARTPLE